MQGYRNLQPAADTNTHDTSDDSNVLPFKITVCFLLILLRLTFGHSTLEQRLRAGCDIGFA